MKKLKRIKSSDLSYMLDLCLFSLFKIQMNDINGEVDGSGSILK